MQATPYYAVDLRRLSWAERWRISRSSLRSFIALLCGFRRQPFLRNWAMARDPVQFVEPNAVPGEVAAKLKPLVELAATMEFVPCLCHTLDCVGTLRQYTVVMLGSDNTTCLSVVWMRAGNGKRPSETVLAVLVSKLSDGRLVVTCSFDEQVDMPKGVRCVYLPGQTLASLLEKHVARLAMVPPHCVVRLDQASARELVAERFRRTMEFNIERGVYSPLSDEETRRLVDLGDPPTAV